MKAILLSGSNEDDVPSDLFGFSERFAISAFDADGLETLLRSLLENGGAWTTRTEAKQAAKRQRRQADKAATQIEAQDEVSDEPEMAELPEAWQRFPSGQPAPTGSLLSMRLGGEGSTWHWRF